MESKPFSYKKIFVIGGGFFALILIWTFYNAYMPLILGDYIKSRAIRGAIMGLDNLLAVILIPIIGAWSDKIDTKLGNRLPFLLAGMPAAAIFFMLIPYGAETALWALIAVDIVFLFAMTIYRAPVISLMPDHTPPNKRSTANGIINFMGGVGAIIALFGLSHLYGLNRSYPFLIAGIILLFTFLFLYFTVDRKPPYATVDRDESEELQAAKSLLAGFSQLKEEKFRGQLYILLAIFVYFIGYTGIEAQFTVYAVEHLLIDESVAGLTLGFFSLSFVIFSIPVGLLGSKLGKEPVMLIGLIILPIIFIIIPLLPLIHSSIILLQAILFLGGVAWSFINVQAYPLVSDLGGKTKIGYFTGLYYLFSMAAAIIAPSILGLLMDVIHPTALFYSASITFFIAFYLLKKGSTIVKNNTKVA